MLNLEVIILSLIFLVIGVFVIWNNEVCGKTWYVDDEGRADFKEIQKAIDSAENGDTIKVYEGNYYENVVVDKSINIIGNGEINTTIDGGNVSDVLTIKSDWVNISGFKIINSGNHFLDCGIKVESSNNIISENNCSLHNNGIYFDFS